MRISFAGVGVPAALTGGTVGGLFGTGGPPYVIYLAHRIHDKSILRATLSALFFVEGLTRIIAFLRAGLLMSREIWVAYFLGLPVVLGVLFLGSRVYHGLSSAQATRLIGAVGSEPVADDQSNPELRSEVCLNLRHCLFFQRRLPGSIRAFG